MDFLTKEAYNEYTTERVMSQMEIESKKYSFQRNLEGEFGKKILQDLANNENYFETKITLWNRIKNWLRKRREKRIYRRYCKKENEIAYLGVMEYLKQKGER